MRKALPFLTLAAALSLSACGSDSSTTTSSIDGDEGDIGEYTVNTETGEANVTLETQDGTATMRSGADVPVDLPGGFSIYPGAEVVSNTVYSQGASQGSLVTMQSDDTPEKIADYYRKQAEAAGIEIQMEMTVNDGKMIGGESEDGLTFSINASPSGDGSTAQLAVGKDLSG